MNGGRAVATFASVEDAYEAGLERAALWHEAKRSDAEGAAAIGNTSVYFAAHVMADVHAESAAALRALKSSKQPLEPEEDNDDPPRIGGWQPIQTAPKTGDDLIAKPILAYCPDLHPNDRITIVWWEPKIRGGSWAREGDTTDFAASPTHWMPLPDPPPTDGGHG